jgi:TonB family protein
MAGSSTLLGKPPEAGDRRLCSRHQAPLTYVELGEDSGGTVLNISESGLAVQAVTSIADQLLKMRFKFSEQRNRLEINGRIAWTSESKKMAGVEFVNLPDKALEQIRAWISFEPSLSRQERKPNPTEQIVNRPITSETAREISAAEDQADQDRDPIFYAQAAISNSEMSGSTGVELREPVRDAPVSCESGSICLKDVDLPNKESALRSAEETSHKPEAAQQKSNIVSLLSRNWYWLAAFVALLIVSSIEARNGHVLHDFFIHSDSPAGKHMGLRLEHVGSDWRFSWDPDAAIISKATKGRLSITDGTFRRILDLDPSDLRGGTIVYTPLTNDVVLRLEVDSADSRKTVSEAVRIAAGRPPSIASNAPFEDNRTDSKRTTSSTGSRTNRIDGSGAQAETSIPMGRLLTSLGSPRTDSSKFPADVNPIEVKAIRTGETRGADTSPPTPRSPVVPEPAIKSGAVLPELPFAVAPTPELTASSSHFDDAILIARKEPVYPALATQSNLSGTVEVRFHIRADGTVRDVVVMYGNPVLAKAAVEAVQMWHYKPARLNGIPLETEGNALLNFGK